ncbi:MAG: LysR substrate-binding domain-containing protein, partial [Bacteroidota bacterium]
MNIRQIEYILSVAEHRHFELAAEKCFVSQSTLSTMISKYEEETGIKIFNRKKKPVELTKEGKLIVQLFREIQKKLECLAELTKEIKGEIKGRLTLSIIPTIAPYLLPLFIKEFAQKFPELNITVNEETTCDIIRKLKSRETDIGIVSIPLKENDLQEIKLYDEPFLVYDAATTSNKNINIKKMDFSNLWLLEEGHCMRTQVMEICELNKRQKNSITNLHFRAGSIDSLLRFVKSSKGKTLLPFLATEEFSKNDRKHLRNFESPIPLRTIGLIIHQDFAKKKILEL